MYLKNFGMFTMYATYSVMLYWISHFKGKSFIFCQVSCVSNYKIIGVGGNPLIIVKFHAFPIVTEKIIWVND